MRCDCSFFQPRCGWLLLLASLVVASCKTNDVAKFAARSETNLADAEFQEVKLRNGVRPHHLAAEESAVRLGVGDLLEIEILEQPTSRAVCMVMPDGVLFYDLAGGVMAQGKTVEQLESILTENLERQKEYRLPVVSVNFTNSASRTYTVLGQVGKPGSFPIPKPTRLLEAIGRCGGIESGLADLRRSVVIRNNTMICPDFNALITDGDMSQNMYLRPGDYVFVPLLGRDKVHVLGEVSNPSSVPFEPEISLISAIASAGGPTPGAALGRVAIVRGSALSPRIATVNLKDIMSGKTSDFRLYPDDIIWVPRSPWEKLEEYATDAVRTAVSTLTNRGVREAYGTNR